jgi:hypothetical protein
MHGNINKLECTGDFEKSSCKNNIFVFISNFKFLSKKKW